MDKFLAQNMKLWGWEWSADLHCFAAVACFLSLFSLKFLHCVQCRSRNVMIPLRSQERVLFHSALQSAKMQKKESVCGANWRSVITILF